MLLICLEPLNESPISGSFCASRHSGRVIVLANATLVKLLEQDEIQLDKSYTRMKAFTDVRNHRFSIFSWLLIGPDMEILFSE